jgi:hypothetical protein
MGSVLYYSNYCQNSKELLQILSKTKLKEDIHYFCIDNRVRKPNGMIYIVLANNQEIILPPNVTKVPALMLINKNHQVITGKENFMQKFMYTLHVKLNDEDEHIDSCIGGLR